MPVYIPRREESQHHRAVDLASDYVKPSGLVTECSSDMGCISVFIKIGLQAP